MAKQKRANETLKFNERSLGICVKFFMGTRAFIRKLKVERYLLEMKASYSQIFKLNSTKFWKKNYWPIKCKKAIYHFACISFF